MKPKRLQHARTCVFNANYHLVWTTKYRRKVLVRAVAEHLESLCRAIGAEKGFDVQQVQVMPDHVHVFVSAHPKISPGYIYKMLKGISARRMFMECPTLKKALWRGHLWNTSTYVETVGRVSDETIQRYIEEQKTK